MQTPSDHTYRGSIALRFLALIVMATAGALAFLPADLRPIVLRVSLVAALAMALFNLVGRAIAALREHAASDFSRALEAPERPARVDSTLLQLRDEIRHSRRSHRYFEKILWPRLLALAAHRGMPEAELPKPASGLVPGSGPSLTALNRLVDRLEKPR